MGSWGHRLYAGDFALDLRSTIRAVARLPFDPDRLLQIVCDNEAAAANDPGNDDHTTFWLVVADQFARRSIASARARDTAIAIIDSGRDLDTQRRLGRSEGGIAKRRRQLLELRARVADRAPSIARRTTLRAPQPFLMDVGDALIYPTCGGRCWNPYTTRPDQLMIYGPRGGEPWQEDGWGAMVIVERGRAFGFFAWYRPLVIDASAAIAPDLASLRDAGWHLETPGTCTPVHYKRMRLEKVGAFSIDATRLERLFPSMPAGDAQAVSDISIANRMRISAPGTPPASGRRGGAAPLIRIDDLAR